MMDERTPHEVGELGELLERRERVRGWLERLESESDANPRVSARIREDYTAQLASIDGALAERQDALREERARLDEEIARVEAAHLAAQDALEEVALRHRIGEIDSDAWASRRAELEPAVREHGDALDELRERATRLAGIVDAVRGEAPTERPPAPPLPELLRPVGSPPEAVSEAVESGREESTPPAPAPDGDPVPLHPDEEDLELTRPGPGVKCVECGYTNDFDALYCGVCGVDLS